MSDFMEQFRAGFQMGQTRNENARRNQDLQMEQERQRFIRQQQMEELKLKKQEIDLQSKRLKQEDTLREFELAEKARMTQAAAPPPTAAMAGIPQQSPDMAGPPPEQIQIPQPMQEVESVTGGPALQLPKLFGGQIAAMQAAAEQQKRSGAIEQKVAEAEAMQPFEQAKFDREAGLKRELAGQRTKQMQALLGSFGTAKTEGQQNKVEVAQYGLAQMPKWQKFINDNTDKFGFYAGRATKIKQSGALEPFGVKADKKTADFTSSLGVVRNAMLNALSGAAISPQEYERMKDQIPLLEDPPDVVKAKMATLDDYFKFRLKNFNAPYQGPGWEQEQPPPAALAAPPKGGMENSLGTWYGIEILSGGDE